ncbi:hypothetical protein CYMTET_38691 [Cymbomonas tetramitiformis]|uniref:DUF1917-domain-containing protein n=1 Tax=Cymbomonas tetramitiformis TaxID=36881 RepID=A0AAE0F585_9CHLO|nr:hypothetical protein CYMTET_38691 [Cymbomonas tetramitiformis]
MAQEIDLNISPSTSSDCPSDGAPKRKRNCDWEAESSDVTVADSQPLMASSSAYVKDVPVAQRVVGGWIAWPNSFLQESLDGFLRNVRPSQAHWITVRNMVEDSSDFEPAVIDDVSAEFRFREDDYAKHLAAITDLIESQERVKGKATVSAATKKQCIENILKTAKAQQYTQGKWMLFPQKQDVDSVWEKIARATVVGELGCSSKVATSNPNDLDSNPLICMYTSDFTDLELVKRLLGNIRGLGFQVRAGFKPDVFTLLGINSGNKWRLSPTMYGDLLRE